MKYRKKPIIVEAFRWLIDETPKWWKDISGSFEMNVSTGCVYIHTREGTMTALEGDYIIQGIKGELYPCKPDIFEATYEPVVEYTPTGNGLSDEDLTI